MQIKKTQIKKHTNKDAKKESTKRQPPKAKYK